MTRERGLGAYNDEFGIDVEAIALESLAKHDRFVWYDMCCGDFQGGRGLSIATNGKAESVGVDLDTVFIDDYIVGRNAVIRRGDVIDYPLPENVDLITCVMGLYYIQRHQKAASQAIEHWYNALPIGSRMIVQMHREMPQFTDMTGSLSARFGTKALRWADVSNRIFDVTKSEEWSDTF